jgi:hypothetical protein
MGERALASAPAFVQIAGSETFWHCHPHLLLAVGIGYALIW